MRLFVAIDVPPPVRAALVATKRPIEGARWVPEDQLHLTLRFIGDTSDEMKTDIQAALRSALERTAPFSISLFGVGRFPPSGASHKGGSGPARRYGGEQDVRRATRDAHVLWAGVQPTERLVELAAKIDEAVIAAGVSPDKKPFSPHITLARLKDSPGPSVQRFLDEHARLTSDAFEIGEAILYSSILSSSGAQHAVESRHPLPVPSDRSD